MARGIERQGIFRADADREDLVDRLEKLAPKTGNGDIPVDSDAEPLSRARAVGSGGTVEVQDRVSTKKKKGTGLRIKLLTISMQG